MMGDLKDLITALEGAKEGNWDLDRRILASLETHVLEKRGRDKKTWWYHKDGEKFALRLSDERYAYGSINGRIPAFTKSIDAALTLVPEGWGWDVMHDCVAALRPPDSEGDDELAIWGLSADGTPATALCIAALRAHQAEGNGNG